MNERSTNRSFDAAMRLFQTRQRLEGGGVGENEGHRPALGGVGGLALCAGLGLGHSDGLPRKFALGRSEAAVFVNSVLADLGLAGEFGLANVGLHLVRDGGVLRQNLLDGAAEAGGELGGGEGGLDVHGGSKSGPIPAMSNPKPVTSDESSVFFGRIMNGPIPYQITPEGRAIAAAYKKRQEESK